MKQTQTNLCLRRIVPKPYLKAILFVLHSDRGIELELQGVEANVNVEGCDCGALVHDPRYLIYEGQWWQNQAVTHGMLVLNVYTARTYIGVFKVNSVLGHDSAL